MLGEGTSEWAPPNGAGRCFVRAGGRNRVESPEVLEVPPEQHLIDVRPDRG